MHPALLAAAVSAAALAATAIVAAATRLPPPASLPDRAGYLRRWREVHGLEPGRMSGGLVDAWLALPYALARPLAKAGVRPDVLTGAGVVLAVAAAVPYLAGGAWVALAAPLVAVAGVADQVDGAVAVLSRRTTAFGAVWDSTADRLADLALLAAPAAWIASSADRSRTAGLVALTAAGSGTFLLEYVRARTQAVGRVTGQVVTVGERPTRVVVIALAAPVAAVAGPATWLWTAVLLTSLTAAGTARLLVDAARPAGPPGGPTTPTTPASA